MLKQPLPGPARRALGAMLAVTLFVGGGYAAWAAQPAKAVAANPSKVPYLTRVYADDVFAPPAYPAEAKGVSGKVMLELLVGSDGRVKEATIVKSEPAGLFDQPSIDAAMKWKLHPATSNGVAVESRVRVPIEFKDPATPAKD